MKLIQDNILKNNLNSGAFKEILEKINCHQRLTADDGLKLYSSYDILSIGALADYARIKRLEKHNSMQKKDYVYWINNHHLNLTNICEGKCKFCAFRKTKNQKGAYLISLESAVEYFENNVDKNVSEIHLVSALNPACNLDYYTELLKNCRRILPNTHIQAFTAVEIEYLARISGLSIENTLKELKKAGLGSLPGGGAEIFSPDIRKKVCPDKISGQKWLEIMKIAHSLDLKSNATMLCGIGESSVDKINHMISIRETQDISGGFMSFIPLFCHYENTELPSFEEITGIDILKEYAIVRLMLDNVPHIKAFWIQIGIKLAQLSLAFGVDDIDGTVVEERITHSAGAKTGMAIGVEELTELVKNAGKIPVERDTVYNLLKVY